MNRLYVEAVSGLLPREPALVVGQPTALDPTRAPAGKHVLWVQVRVLPAEIRADAGVRFQATEWGERERGLCRSRPLDHREFTPRFSAQRSAAARLVAARPAGGEPET